MSNISIFKNENLKKEFTDGFCTVRILEETCPEVSIELCTLKAGAAKDFETYSFEDRMQIFTFSAQQPFETFRRRTCYCSFSGYGIGNLLSYS